MIRVVSSDLKRVSGPLAAPPKLLLTKECSTQTDFHEKNNPTVDNKPNIQVPLSDVSQPDATKKVTPNCNGECPTSSSFCTGILQREQRMADEDKQKENPTTFPPSPTVGTNVEDNRKIIIVDPTQADDPVTWDESSEESPNRETNPKEIGSGVPPPLPLPQVTTSQTNWHIAEPEASSQQSEQHQTSTSNTPPNGRGKDSSNQIRTESQGEGESQVPKGKKVSKKVYPGLKQSLADDPVADFVKELKEPVSIQYLARMYGIDLCNLKASLAKESDSNEYRMAEREMQVLEGIQKYLKDARETIYRSGEVFHVKISPLPCRILSVEQRRFQNLLHSNHRSRHTYTNVGAGVLYRCPLPGCAGATLNQASVKRALLPHCRAYHNTDSLRFVFNIESKRGREAFLFPPEKDRAALQPNTLVSQCPAAPQADMHLTPLSQDPSEPPECSAEDRNQQAAFESTSESLPREAHPSQSDHHEATNT